MALTNQLVHIRLTYPCAILHNFQNVVMHKSELKIHPTVINRVIKEYEFRVGTIGTHKNAGPLRIKF